MQVLGRRAPGSPWGVPLAKVGRRGRTVNRAKATSVERSRRRLGSSRLGPSFLTERLIRLTQPDRASRAVAQSSMVDPSQTSLGSRFLIELARRSSIFIRASKQAHRFNTRRPRRILGQAASARSGSVLRQRPSCWCHRADLRDPCTLGRGGDQGCKVTLVV